MPPPALPKPASQKAAKVGSVHNPIEIDETSSHRDYIWINETKKLSKPHKFQKRHRQLYTYQPERQALALRKANGTTFTGNKHEDIYRMMNAKVVAHGYGPIPLRNPGYRVPFEVQCPLSARLLAEHPKSPQHKKPFTGGEFEDMLRRKLREYTQVFPESDPPSDNPNESEAVCASPSASQSSKKTASTAASAKESIANTDVLDHVKRLSAQAYLLHSLLRVYPSSKDQGKLRKEIEYLVSIQQKSVSKWIKKESANDATKIRNANAEKRKQRDAEVGNYLSAEAGMWSHRNGEGLADVFAAGDDEMKIADSEDEGEE